MCLQCNSLPVYFGEPLPGWTLVRARAHDEDWPIGWWGLLRINDPDFVWEMTPVATPTFGMSEKQEDDFLDRAQWGGVSQTEADADGWLEWPAGRAFVDAFVSTDPETGYELVAAGIKMGFVPGKWHFAVWLFEYLGHYLKNAEMEIDTASDDAARERNKWVDHSIGRDPLPSVLHPVDYTLHDSNMPLSVAQRAAIALLVAAQGDPALDEQMAELIAAEGTTFQLRLRTAGAARRSTLADGKAPATIDVVDDDGKPVGEMLLYLRDGQIRAISQTLVSGDVPAAIPDRSHVQDSSNLPPN